MTSREAEDRAPADPFGAGRDDFAVWNDALWDPMGERTVEAAGLRPGQNVLDVCCGAGGSALPAARRVGSTGTVDAVDLSPGLLSAGRQRARAEGLHQIRWVAADAAQWDRTGYDALICCYGVFFFPDMDGTTARLLRSVRPGGAVAVATWRTGAMAEFVPRMFAAIGPFRPDLEPPAQNPNAQRIDSAAGLTGWLHELALTDVDVIDLPLTVPLTPSTAWSLVAGTGFRSLLPPEQERWPDIRRELWRRLAADGVDTIVLDSQVGVGTCR